MFHRSVTTDAANAQCKLLGSRGIKLRLALASGVVLLLGALMAPGATPTVISAPEERAAPLIVEQVQQRAAAEPFRGVQELAARVGGYGVAVPGAAAATARTRWDYGDRDAPPLQAAGFGVFVTPLGDLLTHAAALDGRSDLTVQTPAGALVQASLVAYEPETGLAMLRTSEAGSVPAAPLAPGRVEPGTLVTAAAHWDGSRVAVPAFVTTEGPNGYIVSAAAGSIAPGTPIYDMDGRLVAIAGGGGTAGLAHPAQEAVDRLTMRIASGRGRESSLGLALQPLDGGLVDIFGDAGVLVSDILEHGPAAQAGIRAGDVVLAVGDISVDSLDAARRAIGQLPANAPATVRIARDRRPQDVSVAVATAFTVAALAQTRPGGGDGDAPEAQTLFTDEQLRAAAIAPSAHVLQLNGRPRPTPAQAAREMRRAGAVSVYLRHGGRRFFAALPGTR